MVDTWTPAAELGHAMASGDASAEEITTAFIERGQAVEEGIHAYLAPTFERAVDEARAADDRRTRGEALSAVDGIPLAFKDVFVTKGVPSTSGSRILDGWVPPYDATVVARCSEAGLPMLGKLDMDEFAMGSSGENSGFGGARNPWDAERVPGGSSSGPAALVAAGGAPWAWGTDTGGSVRQPAALCGIVGVKPTYGLVSRYGMIAFASSLDQASPFARTVEDAAMLLQLACGHDPMDSTSIPDEVPDFLDGIDAGIEGMRIGVVKEFQGEGAQPGVRTRVDEAYKRLEKLGAKIEEISLPSFEYGISAYYLIAPAEASANLARYDGVRYGYRAPADDIVTMTSHTREDGFGDEVKRRIMLGTYVLSAGYYDAYYLKAQQVRTLVRRDYDLAFEKVEAVVMPTSPTAAFRIGEKIEDPLSLYLTDVFTVSANLAGLPALSVPCGLTPANLPIGLQLTGKPFDEETLLRVGDAYERDTNWWKQCPI